jgi:hypothetical protein
MVGGLPKRRFPMLKTSMIREWAYAAVLAMLLLIYAAGIVSQALAASSSDPAPGSVCMMSSS